MSQQGGYSPDRDNEKDNPYAAPPEGAPQGLPYEGYAPPQDTTPGQTQPRGGCRRPAGWVAVVLGAALILLGLIRLVVVFTLDVPDLAYAIGYALGPAIIGLPLVGVGALLLRRRRG